jgi:hypothetical protein
MAPLTHAASRRTTNSKPSYETSVTYLLNSWSFVVVILEFCVEEERDEGREKYKC